MTRNPIANALFQELIRKRISPYLFQLGFKGLRRLGSFAKWREDCMMSLHCGFLDGKFRDEGWLYITVGIGFRRLDEFLAEFDPDAYHALRPCSMGASTGKLRGGPPYQAIEWHLTPDVQDSDLPLLGDQIIAEIEEYAFPFLKRFDSLEACIKAWEAGEFFNTSYPHADYNLAGAYWINGDSDRAVRHVADRLESWRLADKRNPNQVHRIMISEYERFLDFLKAHLQNACVGLGRIP
jgi:hypothetical protein